MRRRHGRWVVPVLLVLVPVAFVVGAWAAADPGRLPGGVRDLLGADEQATLYDDVIDRIAGQYYRPVDRSQLLDKSLDGAVKSLDDRFSNYFSPQEYARFRETTSGEFQGVGLNVAADPRGLRVVSVFANTPASRGGLRREDVIVAVDGRPLRGRSADEAVALIKGPRGSAVTLTVRRKGARDRRVTLRRADVKVPVVRSELVRQGSAKVGHVTLATFSSGAHAEVAGALRKLRARGAKAVVLDLRDNGGGLLDEAVLVSSLFIPEGTIVSTRGRDRPSRTYRATGDTVDATGPLVVLVNRQSASASEIVTGALQDRRRAKVVGTRTYGKGVFQEVEQLPNGGALDITVGEYFTPSGRNLGGGGPKRGAGITPDVRAQDDPRTPKRDEALQAALRTVARPGA
jgi:carboxyl-terminal processing protease